MFESITVKMEYQFRLSYDNVLISNSLLGGGFSFGAPQGTPGNIGALINSGAYFWLIFHYM